MAKDVAYPLTKLKQQKKPYTQTHVPDMELCLRLVDGREQCVGLRVRLVRYRQLLPRQTCRQRPAEIRVGTEPSNRYQALADTIRAIASTP